MSFPTNANGWNLIQMPEPWAYMQMDFGINDTVAETTSPFSRQSQIFAWPGADWWDVTVTLPPMKDRDGGAWTSFLQSCAGQVNAFLLGNPMRRAPLGSASSTAPLALYGAASAAAKTITVKNFKPNAHRLLLAGDMLQINYRLHQVQDVEVSSDSNGNATIHIWPSIRESLLASTPVATRDAQGIFRLKGPARKFSIGQDQLYTMSFEATEAR